MKAAVLLLGVVAMLAFTPMLSAQNPRVKTVTPDAGKAGDTVEVTGDKLDSATVQEMYLTNGKDDFKAAIVSQDDGSVKFTVPKAAAGRYSLMVKAKGQLWEQPVKFTVQE